MSQLKLGSIRDLQGLGGFTLAAGGITANGTLTVTDIVIDGTISGSSAFILPNPSGNSGRFLTTNGSTLSYATVSTASGIRSIQAFTGNGTWNKPTGVRTIMVTVVGAGGGGSGYCESAGAGGMAQRQVDVTNVSSVSVTVGTPGGGTNYAGCGGNGNTSSFGSYCSAGGGLGANCSQQHSGGWGGNGSGGSLNIYGGGGNGHGSHYSYGNHTAGSSYMGGTQPSSHSNSNYSHNHQSHCAWGAGGNGSRDGNRGARGREGIVYIHEYFG